MIYLKRILSFPLIAFFGFVVFILGFVQEKNDQSEEDITLDSDSGIEDFFSESFGPTRVYADSVSSDDGDGGGTGNSCCECTCAIGDHDTWSNPTPE